VKIIDFLNYSVQQNFFESPPGDILAELAKDSKKLLFFYHDSCHQCQRILKIVPKTKKVILVNTREEWVRSIMPFFNIGSTPSIAEMKNNIPTSKLIDDFTSCYRTIINL